jgi:PPOX class probable FMN-dependent enzyme
MAQAPFGDLVQSEMELREVVPEPPEDSPPRRKQIDHLDAHCRDFIARSPFFLLATASSAGDCDASPRGGPPGFVRLLDERRLIVPEYPGNRRADSHRNLLENPRAAMLFAIPGLRETLRVAGRAYITRDKELLAAMGVNGRAPKLGIGLEVEEAFIHCAKAFIRSHLWEPESWPEELPSAAAILREHMDVPDLTTADVAARLEEGYAKRLY